MIRRIIDWSLRFRLLLVVAAAVLLFFGVGKLREMAVDVYPEFGPVVVEVQSEALGLSAHEVAELITVPLEADLLSNIPWVDILRSKSVAGLSSVELIFEPGTELMRARQVVQERLSEAAVALPGASKPPQMLQPRSSMTRVMMIGLTSESQSAIDMSVLARWNIRPRLMGIPGVANVAIWGQREQQLQVLADPARLQALRVPLQDVIETTANALWASPLSFVEAAVPGTGGFIDTPNQRIGIQHISPITSPPDLARITLAGRPDLRLADVASVVEDHQPLIGDAILNNGPGLLLVVEKWPESSTLEVTRRVEEALAAMAPGLGGITVDSSIYRPASYIENAIDNLTRFMAAAAVLIFLVFVALLLDWRAALLGAITIPLSLIAAAVIVHLLGGTMNLMVLGGLVVALVLLIDDAVIRAFAIRRSLEDQTQGGSTAAAIREGLAEAHRPLTYAALIVLVGLLPLVLLERCTRRLLSADGSRLWRSGSGVRRDRRNTGARPRHGALPGRAATASAVPFCPIAPAPLRGCSCVGAGGAASGNRRSCNCYSRRGWTADPSESAEPAARRERAQFARSLGWAARRLSSRDGPDGEQGSKRDQGNSRRGRCRLARGPRNHFRPGSGNQFRRDLDSHRS